jgi:CubicO group peptidase (beta-lactamase class C family)
MATISKEAQAGIAKSMDEMTSDPQKPPGVVFASVNKNGETIIPHASGKRGIDSDEPMTLDSVFWIASCTKMIVGLACMQLVEAGRLKLDDAYHLAQLCPPLRTVKILKGIGKEGKPEMVEKKNRITLRMLLTHTAGFGYSFFDNKIKRSKGAEGWDEFSGDADNLLTEPLVFEPGTAWEYGVNIDWAGRAVEQVTGKTLNDYVQEISSSHWASRRSACSLRTK